MTKSRGTLRAAAWILCLALALGMGRAAAETRVSRILVGEAGAALRSSPEYLEEDNRIMGVNAGTELTVLGEYGSWYLVRYKGCTGYVTNSCLYVTVLETEWIPGLDFQSGELYDLGIPQLGGRVISPGEMNLAVLWTQTQLNAAGLWNGADSPGLTGQLDAKTQETVRAFMVSRGYENHTGWIDADVILELTLALGRNRVPVMVGGFYRAMDSIMGQGCTGSMATVTVNPGGGIPGTSVLARWAQVCLRYLGYYTGEITDRFDEKTGLALHSFQADHGFGECDFLTPGVARTMLECYVEAEGELNALP